MVIPFRARQHIHRQMVDALTPGLVAARGRDNGVSRPRRLEVRHIVAGFINIFALRDPDGLRYKIGRAEQQDT